MPTIAWTADRVEQLKKLWDAGRSATQIALEMGYLTRNAVLGKVHRLGLPERKTPDVERRPVIRDHRVEHARRRERRAPVPAEPRPPRDYPFRAAKIDVPPPLYLSLTDPLFFKRCRFITPMPGEPETRYCGNEVVSGAWCPAHYQVVYVPAEERRKARAA